MISAISHTDITSFTSWKENVLLFVCFVLLLSPKKSKSDKPQNVMSGYKPISSFLIWLSDLLTNILLESSSLRRWRNAAKSQKQCTALIFDKTENKLLKRTRGCWLTSLLKKKTKQNKTKQNKKKLKTFLFIYINIKRTAAWFSWES